MSEQSQKGGVKKPVSQEQIIGGFNELRQQQRAVAGKISELEMEQRDHDLVIEALKEVDGDRKCFRLVGGVLVERTVKEVLPALQVNYEQIGKLTGTLTTQLENKGKDLTAYREKHGIRIRGEEESQQNKSTSDKAKSGASGVLVAKDSS